MCAARTVCRATLTARVRADAVTDTVQSGSDDADQRVIPLWVAVCDEVLRRVSRRNAAERALVAALCRGDFAVRNHRGVVMRGIRVGLSMCGVGARARRGGA